MKITRKRNEENLFENFWFEYKFLIIANSAIVF